MSNSPPFYDLSLTNLVVKDHLVAASITGRHISALDIATPLLVADTIDTKQLFINGIPVNPIQPTVPFEIEPSPESIVRYAQSLNINTDGFVVCSPAIESTNSASPARMFYDPGTTSVRAGLASGTQWDVGSRGTSSVAFGEDTTASGFRSVVSGGFNNTASGQRSTVVGGSGNTSSATASISGGDNSTASSLQSVALGNSCTASGGQAIALGNVCTASGPQSFAIGNNSVATGNQSVAMGDNAVCNGSASFAINTGASATADNVLSMGFFSAVASQYASAIGGQNNTISGGAALRSSILGGNANNISAGAVDSIILGGNGCAATGSGSLLAGKSATDGGLANCFVFGGATGATPSLADQFVIGSAAATPLYLPNATVGAAPGAAVASIPIRIGGVTYQLALY